MDRPVREPARVRRLSEEDVETLLAPAPATAHASERTVAPLSCWLAGAAGIPPAEALASELASEGADTVVRQVPRAGARPHIARMSEIIGAGNLGARAARPVNVRRAQRYLSTKGDTSAHAPQVTTADLVVV